MSHTALLSVRPYCNRLHNSFKNHRVGDVLKPFKGSENCTKALDYPLKALEASALSYHPVHVLVPAKDQPAVAASSSEHVMKPHCTCGISRVCCFFQLKGDPSNLMSTLTQSLTSWLIPIGLFVFGFQCHTADGKKWNSIPKKLTERTERNDVRWVFCFVDAKLWCEYLAHVSPDKLYHPLWT